MKDIIGKRIRKLRESKDYTQYNMATEMGITAGAYAKIERGETDVSLTRLVQIAEILGVHITSFLKDSLPDSIVEQSSASYGFASKEDLENLSQMVQQMKREIETIKTELFTGKKPGKHKHK